MVMVDVDSAADQKTKGKDKGKVKGEEESREAKRRRVTRACDSCRKKKIRCTGVPPGKSACLTCLTYGYDCIFSEEPKRKPAPRWYVEALEARLERAEGLLSRLHPGSDFSRQLGPPVHLSDGADPSSNASAKSGPNDASFQSPPLRSQGASAHTDSDSEDENDMNFVNFGVQAVTAGRQEPTEKQQYVGRSSVLQLVVQLKMPEAGGDTSLGPAPRAWTEFDVPPVGFFDHRYDDRLQGEAAWWPPDDLALDLVNIYFDRINAIQPIVHRPSFMREFADPVMRRSRSWLELAYSIFAVASRLSDDPRVLYDPLERYKHTAGLKFWIERSKIELPTLSFPTLRRLQSFILAAMFIMNIPSGSSRAWAYIGVAVRQLQDIGIHRRASRAMIDPLEYEMSKRVFWTLYVLDSLFSTSLGRPMCIHDEDYDVDMPLAVDDEYLVVSEGGLLGQQPLGKPSRVDFFVRNIQLHQVLVRALRNLYAINKTSGVRTLTQADSDTRQLVDQLDGELELWLASLPPHLRYDPNEPNLTKLSDAAVLHTQYHFIQTLAHRPQAPMSKRPPPSDLDPFSKCANAARSTSHILDHLRRKGIVLPMSIAAYHAMTAGCVLLLSVRASKAYGFSITPEVLEDVKHCIEALRDYQIRIQFAGSCRNLLETLLEEYMSDAAQGSPAATGTKRERDSDGPFDSASSFLDGATASAVSSSATPTVVTSAGVPPPGSQVAAPAPTKDESICAPVPTIDPTAAALGSALGLGNLQDQSIPFHSGGDAGRPGLPLNSNGLSEIENTVPDFWASVLLDEWLLPSADVNSSGYIGANPSADGALSSDPAHPA